MLAILLFTPARVRFGYDRGNVSARLGFGPVKLTLYPGEEKEETPPEKPTKEKKPKKEKPPKPKARVNFDQILYSIEKLPPILGKALKRTGRRLRFGPLKVHLLVAGTDPADTALLYGKLEAALAAGLPQLHRLVRIKDQDIQLFLDFQEERMDCVADVGLSIRVWDVLVIALGAGASAVKWFIGFKRLADPPPADTREQDTAKTAVAAQEVGQ